MTYDPTNLRRLGNRMARLRDGLEQAQRELAAEVRAALAAGYPLREVIRDSGYTRDAVYKIRTGERRAGAPSQLSSDR